MEVLDLPDDVNSEKFDELIKKKKSTDVFALDDNELGCTSVASHQIDTGDHHQIQQMPYWTPII